MRLARVISLDFVERIAVHVDNVVEEVDGLLHACAAACRSRSRPPGVSIRARLIEPRLQDS